MKKRITVAVLTLMFIWLLAACLPEKDKSAASSVSSVRTEENSSDILVQSPMTISNNDLFIINGKHQYLRLKMVRGTYKEDWNPGAYMGTLWEGSFIMELADELGNTIASTELSGVYTEPLIFHTTFQIHFDDYNNDGDMDFTIGQYASSNGNTYKLFTLRSDGKIEELPVKDHTSLFISDTTGYYSTKLTKVDDTSFTTEYYDNAKGKTIEEIFKWDGKAFIQDNITQ